MVEGPVLVAEAISAGWTIESVFVAPGVEPLPGAGDGLAHRLAAGVAERVSDVESPSGLFAVIERRQSDRTATLADATFVVVADRIGEPGNLGTIIRSAEASGADAVVVTPGTVDETNPKVVRASAGAIFHVPVVTATLAEVAGAGLAIVGTSSHQGVAHTEFDWTGRVAVVAGNEAAGVEPDDPSVTAWVRIRHHGRAESLNVAMATTVVCFEVARHRPD